MGIVERKINIIDQCESLPERYRQIASMKRNHEMGERRCDKMALCVLRSSRITEKFAWLICHLWLAPQNTHSGWKVIAVSLKRYSTQLL